LFYLRTTEVQLCKGCEVEIRNLNKSNLYAVRQNKWNLWLYMVCTFTWLLTQLPSLSLSCSTNQTTSLQSPECCYLIQGCV
jgi:hypothetical protein